MTALLSIDTAAMHRLAQQIRTAAQVGLDAGDRGSLQSAVTALAAPGLVQAVGLFIEGWGTAVIDLVDDAHRLADAIDLAARFYQDAESVTDRRLLG